MYTGTDCLPPRREEGSGKSKEWPCEADQDVRICPETGEGEVSQAQIWCGVAAGRRASTTRGAPHRTRTGGAGAMEARSPAHQTVSTGLHLLT